MLQNNQSQASPYQSQDVDRAVVPLHRGIDSMTLATLNFGLFRSLYSMGTEREKICSAMLLNADEFDYIVGLINGQKLRPA